MMPGGKVAGVQAVSVPGRKVEPGAGSWALPPSGASPEQRLLSLPAAVQSQHEETRKPG